MADVRRVHGVRCIAGLAGDPHRRGRLRGPRLRAGRRRDVAEGSSCAGRRAGAAGAGVHRARRGLDLRRIPDHRRSRRLYAIPPARFGHRAQSLDERRRVARQGAQGRSAIHARLGQGIRRQHPEHRIQVQGAQGDGLPAARRAVRPPAGPAGDGAARRSAGQSRSPHRRRQHRRHDERLRRRT